MAAVGPLGLFLGRIANFINGELWGRTSDVPWAVIFPGAGPVPRHPSQLYEAVLEGLLLFLVVQLLAWRPRRPEQRGQIGGAFLSGYALCRFAVEFFREPDAQLGYLSGRAHHGPNPVRADVPGRADPVRHRLPPGAGAGALTALAGLLRDLIREQGPLDIGRYMALALAHPEHGYYTSRDPLGAGGDFITAPEISQLFGELVGLALVQFWLDNGRPRPVMLVELGPGRGTLAADALRAARVAPRFLEAAELHLVEASPILRARQAEVLGRHGPLGTPRSTAVPATAPLLVIANEFFDVLPLRQFVHHRGSWHERLVGVDEAGAFQFGLSPRPVPVAVAEDVAEGAVLELAPAREALAQELGQRLDQQGGMALIIDYGEQQPCLGDTFQAVRGHQSVGPLAAPGETDLTAHVDFGAIATAARKGGAVPYGPVPQGLFLRRLGIELRLEQLLARADRAQALALQAGVRRLTAPDAMGELFKVLALTAPGASVPPGFEAGEASP